MQKLNVMPDQETGVKNCHLKMILSEAGFLLYYLL